VKSSALLLLPVALAGCFGRPSIPKYYKATASAIAARKSFQQIVRVDSVDIPLLEWALFHETNVQRRRLGLLPLKYEYKLQQSARQHSREMIKLGYFDHVSPDRRYKTIGMRLRNVGIKHGMGGENIGIHPAQKKQQVVFKVADRSSSGARYGWRNFGSEYTYGEFAQDLVRRLLNSTGHRHNILDRNFRFLGVGVCPSRLDDIDVIYVTQNFSSSNY